MVILPSTSHLYLKSTRYHVFTDPYPSYSNISSLPSQPFTPIHSILHVSLSLYLFCNLTLPSSIYSFSFSPSSVPVQPAPVTVNLIAHTSSSISSHSTDLNNISLSTLHFYPKFTHYSRPSYRTTSIQTLFHHLTASSSRPISLYRGRHHSSQHLIFSHWI